MTFLLQKYVHTKNCNSRKKSEPKGDIPLPISGLVLAVILVLTYFKIKHGKAVERALKLIIMHAVHITLHISISH